jgi:hypothetical protein
MEETLTLSGSALPASSGARCRATTHASLAVVRRTSRNVGNPARSRCAGPPPACSRPERQFRRIIGYDDLAKLAVASERDLTPRRPAVVPAPAEEIPVSV